MHFCQRLPVGAILICITPVTTQIHLENSLQVPKSWFGQHLAIYYVLVVACLYAALATCTISTKEAEQLNYVSLSQDRGKRKGRPPQAPAKTTNKPPAGPIAKSQQQPNHEASKKTRAKPAPSSSDKGKAGRRGKGGRMPGRCSVSNEGLLGT